MEKILTFTNGQHILFGMILSHITNNLNLVFPKSNYGGLCEFIIEIDSPEASNYELTYSESMISFKEFGKNMKMFFWHFKKVNISLFFNNQKQKLWHSHQK